LTACLFFAGTLVPALGFFDVYPMRFSFVADHFQYLASAGLISLAAAASVMGWQRFRLALQPLKYLAGGVVLLLLAMLTWGQSYAYVDEHALWEDTLAKNPNCWLAHNSLGQEYYQHGVFDQAERHFSAALASIPASWTRTRAKAYSNLGVMREAEGKLEEARADYQRAIQLDPQNLSFHLNLGSALARLGKKKEAVQVYEEALRINPEAALAHYSLGIVLAEEGNWRDASDCFRRAMTLAAQAGQFELESQIRERLASYKNQKPIRNEGIDR
jgi:tetratricopeptide (TPR) repeat protein